MNVSSISSTNKDNAGDFILCTQPDLSSEARKCIKSKVVWTREAALSYCVHMNTDYVSSNNLTNTLSLEVTDAPCLDCWQIMH